LNLSRRVPLFLFHLFLAFCFILILPSWRFPFDAASFGTLRLGQSLSLAPDHGFPETCSFSCSPLPLPSFGHGAFRSKRFVNTGFSSRFCSRQEVKVVRRAHKFTERSVSRRTNVQEANLPPNPAKVDRPSFPPSLFLTPTFDQKPQVPAMFLARVLPLPGSSSGISLGHTARLDLITYALNGRSSYRFVKPMSFSPYWKLPLFLLPPMPAILFTFPVLDRAVPRLTVRRIRGGTRFFRWALQLAAFPLSRSLPQSRSDNGPQWYWDHIKMGPREISLPFLLSGFSLSSPGPSPLPLIGEVPFNDWARGSELGLSILAFFH